MAASRHGRVAEGVWDARERRSRLGQGTAVAAWAGAPPQQHGGSDL
jgi:hypothetical protein